MLTIILLKIGPHVQFGLRSGTSLNQTFNNYANYEKEFPSIIGNKNSVNTISRDEGANKVVRKHSYKTSLVNRVVGFKKPKLHFILDYNQIDSGHKFVCPERSERNLVLDSKNYHTVLTGILSWPKQ